MIIKSSIRNITKFGQNTIFNIAGLSVSFTIAILFIGYITKELNTGKVIADSENIFRLQPENKKWGVSKKVFALVDNKFPEVEAQTYLHDIWYENSYYEVDNKLTKADGAIYADSGFFNVFQHQAIAGDLTTALKTPDAIVITESIAQKLFGSTDVIGKALKFKSSGFGEFDFTVSAIIKNLPEEAMLRFNAVIAVKSLHKVEWYASAVNRNWGFGIYQVFFKTKPHVNKVNLENNIFKSIEQHAPYYTIKSYKDISLTQYNQLYFENLTDFDILAHNSKSYIYTLIIVILLIISLVCINYINLFTAQLVRRLKKVGIKKTLGASRSKVILEFAAESAFLVIVSFLISVFLAALFLNTFNHYTDSSLLFRSLFIQQSGLIILCVLVITTLLCGIVPGLFLAAKDPVMLLKNNVSGINGKGGLKNSLLVFQFGISVAFIMVTLLINKQTHYMQSQDTGIKTEDIIYIQLSGDVNTNILHEELLKVSEISDVTYADDIVGQIDNTRGRVLDVAGEQKRIKFNSIEVDTSFFNFFGISLSEGSFFNPSSPGKDDHVFNQTAKNEFGIENIDNAHLTSGGIPKVDIIGVVKDFNFNSLHQPIRPLGFVCRNPEKLRNAYLKINTKSSKQLQYTINNIKGIWDRLNPDWPFQYGFLDQSLARLYEKEQRFSKVMIWATIVSIFIACLGVLGVTNFTLQQRTKEIGIRKVNGARVSEILTTINKDFIKWVAIASVIACPIAWYVMDKWLENFAYKTTLSWWIFVLAGVLTLGIALLTVSWQSWKAATRNPVEALRYE